MDSPTLRWTYPGHVVSSSVPSIGHVRQCLTKLRQGHALSRPTTLLTALDEPVRAHLRRGHEHEPGSADEVGILTQAIRGAIEKLADDERLCAMVDFNLHPDHSYPNLTDRQESLAVRQKCAGKTVRRHAARALDTLAYLLLAPDNGSAAIPVGEQRLPYTSPHERPEHNAMHRFWNLRPGTRVDLVCSEIPLAERPAYASPADRNYLRYAKFADLDTLIFVRTRLAQLTPSVIVRDFASSEHYDTHADVLVVIGGPPWNAKFREFLPQLPFHFEPHPLGEDDPLAIPGLDLTLAPRWTARGELIEDLAVFTRLTLQGTTVFLLGGCLTLGVLGAAYCLLDTKRGPSGCRYLSERVGDDDFMLVVEARRAGGIIDVADLTAVEPLLVLSRPTGEDFGVVIDNTKRYSNRRNATGTGR